MKTELMRFSLTRGGTQVALATPPESVQFSLGANWLNYAAIEPGELLHPRGRKAKRVRWKGCLYGPGRRPFTFVLPGLYRAPHSVVTDIESWVGSDPSGQPIPVLLTISEQNNDVNIGFDVYVDSFTWEMGGGEGDVENEIALVEVRPMNAGVLSGNAALKRSPLATPSSWSAIGDDTPQSVAGRLFGGDTSKWRALRDANPAIANLGPDESIPPGTVLVVPVP